MPVPAWKWSRISSWSVQPPPHKRLLPCAGNFRADRSKVFQAVDEGVRRLFGARSNFFFFVPLSGEVFTKPTLMRMRMRADAGLQLLAPRHTPGPVLPHRGAVQATSTWCK